MWRVDKPVAEEPDVQQELIEGKLYP
jgi:hypothetical protein